MLVLIGFTISLHIAGMYALSPVMGWLTDKAGRLPVILLGHGLILLVRPGGRIRPGRSRPW